MQLGEMSDSDDCGPQESVAETPGNSCVAGIIC